MSGEQQVNSQFWSIERAVAFVVAPIVTPVSGAIAAWLGQNFPGIHVTGAGVAAFAGATALGVAGGFIKWLDGRQKFVTTVAGIESSIGHTMELASPIAQALPAGDREALLREVEAMIEGRIRGVEAKLYPPRVVSLPAQADSPPAASELPDPSLDTWPTPGDPAPDTSTSTPAAAMPTATA